MPLVTASPVTSPTSRQYLRSLGSRSAVELAERACRNSRVSRTPRAGARTATNSSSTGPRPGARPGVEFTVAPDIAEDTISEALGIICDPAAAQRKPDLRDLRGTGQTIQLRPTDTAPGWLITLTPDSPTWTRTTADADVVLSAPVGELMLVFARRRTPAEATVTGDAALIDRWLANTSF